MYRRIIRVMVAGILGVGIAIVPRSCQKQAEGQYMEPPAEFPHEEYTVNAVVLSESGNLADEAFRKAKESFKENDYSKSAEQIRKGIAYMNVEKGTAAAEKERLLNESINELEQIANEVERGAVISKKTMNQAFSRANTALAKQRGYSVNGI